MRCQISRFVWHDAPWPIHLDLVGSIPFPVLVQRLLFLHRFFRVDKASLHQFVLCASLVLDSIWHLRNNAVHNQVQPNPLSIHIFMLELSILSLITILFEQRCPSVFRYLTCLHQMQLADILPNPFPGLILSIYGPNSALLPNKI